MGDSIKVAKEMEDLKSDAEKSKNEVNTLKSDVEKSKNEAQRLAELNAALEQQDKVQKELIEKQDLKIKELYNDSIERAIEASHWRRKILKNNWLSADEITLVRAGLRAKASVNKAKYEERKADNNSVDWKFSYKKAPVPRHVPVCHFFISTFSENYKNFPYDASFSSSPVKQAPKPDNK